jgi:hypothetical protein
VFYLAGTLEVNVIIIVTKLNCCRYKRDEDGLFRLLTVDTKPKKMTQEASQPVCGKEDHTLKQEAEEGKIMVSVLEYDDSGTVVSREDMETTEIHSVPPGSFNILEALSFLE